LVDVGRPLVGVSRGTVVFEPDAKASLFEPLARRVDVIDLPHQWTDLAWAVFGKPGAEGSLAVYGSDELNASIKSVVESTGTPAMA